MFLGEFVYLSVCLSVCQSFCVSMFAIIPKVQSSIFSSMFHHKNVVFNKTEITKCMTSTSFENVGIVRYPGKTDHIYKVDLLASSLYYCFFLKR